MLIKQLTILLKGPDVPNTLNHAAAALLDLGLVQVRQLSGVLLRKHLRSHWRRLPAAAHKQIQTALQQRLVQEPVEPVRRAVAELIASIARWLLAFIIQCSCVVPSKSL